MKKQLLLSIAMAYLTSASAASETKTFFKKQYAEYFKEWVYDIKVEKTDYSEDKISGTSQFVQIRESQIKRLSQLQQCFDNAQSEHEACLACQEWAKKHYINSEYEQLEKMGISLTDLLKFAKNS